MRQRGSLRIVCAVAVLIEACCAWAPARRVHGRLQSAASRRNRFALMAAYGGDAPYAEACYDPAAAEAYFGARPLESLRRLLELAWTSAGFVANVAIDKKLGREEAMAARRSGAPGRRHAPRDDVHQGRAGALHPRRPRAGGVRRRPHEAAGASPRPGSETRPREVYARLS